MTWLKDGPKKKDVVKIQMDLSYGEDVFKGIKDALPEANVSPRKGIYQDSGPPPKLPVFLVSITSGEIKNERITFKTKLGESINLKLNCRENLVLSPSPIKLQMRDVKDDYDVGDLALVKMGDLESGLRKPTYQAVCEGLIIRYKAKVISIDDEPVKIMNVDGNCHQLVSGSVKFDTGNDAATAVSEKLVNDLGLKPNLCKRRKVTLAGGHDMSCGSVEIIIVIRGFEFSVNALVGAVGLNTDLLVGMDVIQSLCEKNFTLGTP